MQKLTDQPYHIILAGAPNVGKSTVFTWLADSADLPRSGSAGGEGEEDSSVFFTASCSSKSSSHLAKWQHTAQLQTGNVQVL